MWEENDHIVLIRSDGSVVYEDGYDPTLYCDVYYCYECPKYGDDCDGKEDNMKQKKKSTPSGAPIPKQNYGTTPEEKSEAEMRFDLIGTGAACAVMRPKDPKVDREFRRLIAEANASGRDCIINAGYGYYRPGENDDFEAELYFASERSRAKEILRKVRRMEEVYNRRYQSNE